MQSKYRLSATRGHFESGRRQNSSLDFDHVQIDFEAQLEQERILMEFRVPQMLHDLLTALRRRKSRSLQKERQRIRKQPLCALNEHSVFTLIMAAVCCSFSFALKRCGW